MNYENDTTKQNMPFELPEDGYHGEDVIEIAVKGMLPKNTLGRDMIKKLKVYAGSEHNHQAQQPIALEIKD